MECGEVIIAIISMDALLRRHCVGICEVQLNNDVCF